MQALPSIIRMIKLKKRRLSTYVACIGKVIYEYIILVEKSKEKTPFERPKRRW